MLRPIHPFPARMAPEIVWSELPKASDARVLSVLDPMAGSGTTVATARLLGHRARGFDTDPLAVLIANAWSSDMNEKRFLDNAAWVLSFAQAIASDISQAEAYPVGADEETKAFVRYWFDPRARTQLTALVRAIEMLSDPAVKNLLWCAFSRLIITKESGVSLAMDVSHSRPHRSYEKGPQKPFDGFFAAARHVARCSPFTAKKKTPRASVRLGDARKLRLESESVDWVITSPPYLNAIDYMRGHRLSLVWMGHRLAALRNVRATSVGTEVISRNENPPDHIRRAMEGTGALAHPSPRVTRMFCRYVEDMDRVMTEVARVLVPKGQALIVVGDSTLRGVFVENSRAIASLGQTRGLDLVSSATRELPAGRRYLPPPGQKGTGAALEARMRTEVVLKFRKPN